MPIFNLHVDGQCLKNSTLVLLKFCDVKLKYIYFTLIKPNIFLINLSVIYLGKRVYDILYIIKIKEIKL